MSGGKRSGVRRHTDNLLEDTKKVKKEFQVDPYPNSMIVRIKMKGDGKSPGSTLSALE